MLSVFRHFGKVNDFPVLSGSCSDFDSNDGVYSLKQVLEIIPRNASTPKLYHWLQFCTKPNYWEK